MAGVVKIVPVKNRLGQALHKPGGIKRDEAVAAAATNVETLREEFLAAIPGEIAALEAMAAAGRGRVSSAELDTMLRRACQLLTLSGTYGCDLLDLVVKRFCDLANGMIEKDIGDSAPVGVHLRAMRLVAPSGPGLNPQEGMRILEGLVQVHTYYGITSLQTGDDQSASAPEPDEPAADF